MGASMPERARARLDADQEKREEETEERRVEGEK